MCAIYADSVALKYEMLHQITKLSRRRRPFFHLLQKSPTKVNFSVEVMFHQAMK